VALPDGTDVAYALDPGLRRVARVIDGTSAGRFLWVSSRPIAELDGSNALVSRFVYAGGTAPAYLVKGGVAHRLITDQTGSVRLVVNAATGAIVQRLDYDSFGRVVLDTNPGFQPFGFAGGLYDPATGLVRFDARDYDAVVGRWTAKDPIGFAGGDANLYRYVGNDPVNLADPSGLGIGEIVLGVIAGLVDVAMFPVTLARTGQELSNAITEAIGGTPTPLPPDPNPIVQIMEAVNLIASEFFGEVEPLADTDGTSLPE
jgi:RHS repeat-associated protein